jgi:hypothetical protein
MQLMDPSVSILVTLISSNTLFILCHHNFRLKLLIFYSRFLILRTNLTNNILDVDDLFVLHGNFNDKKIYLIYYIQVVNTL